MYVQALVAKYGGTLAVGLAGGFSLGVLAGTKDISWIAFSGNVIGASIGAALAVGGAYWVSQTDRRERRRGIAQAIVRDVWAAKYAAGQLFNDVGEDFTSERNTEGRVMVIRVVSEGIDKALEGVSIELPRLQFYLQKSHDHLQSVAEVSFDGPLEIYRRRLEQLGHYLAMAYAECRSAGAEPLISDHHSSRSGQPAETGSSASSGSPTSPS